MEHSAENQYEKVAGLDQPCSSQPAKLRQVIHARYSQLDTLYLPYYCATCMAASKQVRAPAGPQILDADVRELLRRDIERLTEELSRKQHALAVLDGHDTQKAHDFVAVPANQFRGKKIADAAVEYLEMCEAKKGTASATKEELMDALLRGGCSLGKDAQRNPRNLQIALSMNPRRLAQHGDTVSLKR